MKLINGGRSTGKTVKLIITSEMTGYPIVTSTETSVNYIKNMANEMGCKIPEPVSVSKIRNFKYARGNHLFDKVLLDNMEFILSDAIKLYLDTEVVTAVLNEEE